MNEDILLIDKPTGVTSFEVIRRLRKGLGKAKIGHAGTLDPLATGLLVVGIGTGTRKLKDIIGLPKTYEAIVRLGVRTDSGDIDGSVVEEELVPELSDDSIIKALDSMHGVIRINAPIYSALKRGGEALYKKVRRGEEVTPHPVDMEVIETELVGRERNDLNIKFVVGSGTYIRSLAEELGKRLGTVATISALRRTRVGNYKVENAQTLD